MQIAVVGIDLGKNSCSIVGLDDGGAVVLRRRMRRAGVIKLAAKLKSCVVAMEACCGARLPVSYVRVGGLAIDVPEDFVPRCRSLLDSFPALLNDVETLVPGRGDAAPDIAFA